MKMAIRVRFLASIFLLFSGLAFCGDAAQAISENQFNTAYQNQVLPFYSTMGHVGEMRGQFGARLQYIAFEPTTPRGQIIIAPGYNESFRKYAELAYDLNQRGYAVYILDHRGQGASQRFIADSTMGYVDRFEAMVRDLKKFGEHVVPKSKNLPRYLLAHSMGGALAALYLERYPHDYAAAVLSSPMLAINLGHPEWQATTELLALEAMGQGVTYAPGTGPYRPQDLSFATNDVTHSQVRFENNKQILIDNPALFVSGQSVHWVLEGIGGSYLARSHGDRVKTPVRLLQAGQDALVLPLAQKSFCLQAAHCELIRFADARHELFQETDAIRDLALASTLEFFAAARTGLRP